MNLLARAISFGALILALAGSASVAAAKTILVFGPHPDDETLVAGGRVAAAVAAGDTVKIVVVTNGDFNGFERGLARQGDSVAAAQVLGLTEQDVIFLGYPDGSMMQIYDAASPTDVITSNAGQTQTYGNRGMGGMAYHGFRFGSPGAYNRATVEQDIRTLLADYRPDEIYTVSHFDTHTDHQATALFVTEALAALKRADATLSTKLFQGIVWVPSSQTPTWPDAGGCAPNTPFPPPPQLDTQLEWKRTLRAVVLANLKCQAINAHVNSVSDWLLSFARKDEFFWVSDFGANLALTAQVTASSENGANQGRMKAVDGLVDGAPHDATREWVSASQLAGAWIQLDWSAPVSVAQVNLYDRPLGEENVLAGTLSFSDGTSIAVGALPTDGKVMPVTFAPKTVTWVRFTVTQAEGTATGLSEIQVLGVAAQSAPNVAPHFLEGPGGNTDKSIISAETATFSVLAHDLNGDAVQYEWSADGGTIAGSGATAVFTPPAVTQSTVFTISARIFDGRGGSASSVGFVTVAPALDALSLSPTAVFGGDSAQGTVTLASRAPAGGLSVPLSSSNPAAAQVPASVTVPADAVSVSFPVSTSVVGARTTVTLSANIRGTTRTATMEVTPRPAPAPSGNLLLSPDRIGDASWMIFGSTLNAALNFAPAPDGTQNATRALATQPGGHALTQQVAVAENTSYTFLFWARNNGGSAAAYSVHCASNGTDIIPPTSYFSSINSTGWTQVSATFTTPAGCTSILVYALRDSGTPVDVLLWRAVLVPTSALTPALSSVAVSPASLTGGASATGTVTLTMAAPAGGAQVTLSSSNPAAVVPASVTVAAGATSATFSVTTNAVAASTPVTISGSYSGVTQAAALTVLPAVVSSLSVSPASLTGGNPATGTVTLSGPAPAGGAQVALSSNNGAASVPASVTVAAGASTGTFTVTTIPVATSTPIALSASYGGATQSATLTVVPPSLAALGLSASSVTGGSPATGMVALDGPAPAGGVQVALSSSNAAASVPGSVTVPAGQTSVNFNVTTSAVATSTPATISASYGGRTQSVSLTVLPPVVSALNVSPASVTGGAGATGTVMLNGPAPAGGAQVALARNNPAATVPASVTVPAGATSATFSLGTTPVSDPTGVTISASYGGATRTASLTVLPPAVSSLALNPTSVIGGPLGNSTGTVTLNGPAPAGGAQIALASSNSGAASVPSSVTVPAGATSATFTVTTSVVVTTTNATISASYKGSSRSANLEVRSPLNPAL
jgi:LmbE family N-acetylglucosaminyl deacetylase